jgi:hypothetical protein
MNENKKTASLVGVLFIIGTVAGILSVVFTGSVFEDPDYLLKVSANKSQVIIGSLLILVMGFSLTFIPILLFPIFKRYNEVLAIGAIVFRGALEAVAYISIVISWLLILTLSQEYVNAGTPDASNFQTIGHLLLESINWINCMLQIVFSLGACMIYYLFNQSKLIPRWLALWGFLGGIAYLTVPIVGMFGFQIEFLMIPLAVQEMFLAVWLIAKGFNSSAINSI